MGRELAAGSLPTTRAFDRAEGESRTRPASQSLPRAGQAAQSKQQESTDAARTTSAGQRALTDRPADLPAFLRSVARLPVARPTTPFRRASGPSGERRLAPDRTACGAARHDGPRLPSRAMRQQEGGRQQRDERLRESAQQPLSL